MQSRGCFRFSYSFLLNPGISLGYRINLTFSLKHKPSKGMEVLNINMGLFLLPGVWGKQLEVEREIGQQYFSPSGHNV